MRTVLNTLFRPQTSALTMNIAGVVKDWLLIGLSVLLYRSPISRVNLGGYSIAFVSVRFTLTLQPLCEPMHIFCPAFAAAARSQRITAPGTGSACIELGSCSRLLSVSIAADRLTLFARMKSDIHSRSHKHASLRWQTL